MTKMELALYQKKIPLVLIYSRLVMGILVVFWSFLHLPEYKVVAIVLLTLGLLTDIFDGIVARKLNISTPALRKLDSTIDQVFFIAFVFATYVQTPSFFQQHWIEMTFLFGFEALAYLICFVRFRKEIATHTIGAKIWTLFIFATLVEITFKGESSVLFIICFWMGMVTRIEIMAILFVLKEWSCDVPSLFQAIRLRNGKSMKRHRWFNG